MALSAAELRHFDAFGYVVRRALLSADELGEVRAAAEQLWCRSQQTPLEPGREVRVQDFVERHERLVALAGDERLLTPAAQLLGENFVWAGSEGNCSATTAFGWHADRKYWGPPASSWPDACGRGAPQEDLSLCDFTQLKVSVYLDQLNSANGCFRAIPGSHRPPLYNLLGPQECAGNRWGESPDPMPFGLAGSELPCVYVETSPGDVIFWHSCLWHSVYVHRFEQLPVQSDDGRRERRYIALKFSSMPTRDAEYRALHKYMRYFPKGTLPSLFSCEQSPPALLAVAKRTEELGEHQSVKAIMQSAIEEERMEDGCPKTVARL